MKQKHQRQTKTRRNPLYVKIGKRIRQARLMAKESNSRALSERLGWSGGRINNFETGASTPGMEETLQLAEVLSVDPCWLTYGVGSPRSGPRREHRSDNLDAPDESQTDALPDEMGKLLALYAKLSDADKERLYGIGQLLLKE